MTLEEKFIKLKEQNLFDANTFRYPDSKSLFKYDWRERCFTENEYMNYIRKELGEVAMSKNGMYSDMRH